MMKRTLILYWLMYFPSLPHPDLVVGFRILVKEYNCVTVCLCLTVCELTLQCPVFSTPHPTSWAKTKWSLFKTDPSGVCIAAAAHNHTVWPQECEPCTHTHTHTQPFLCPMHPPPVTEHSFRWAGPHLPWALPEIGAAQLPVKGWLSTVPFFPAACFKHRQVQGVRILTYNAIVFIVLRNPCQRC